MLLDAGIMEHVFPYSGQEKDVLLRWAISEMRGSCEMLKCADYSHVIPFPEGATSFYLVSHSARFSGTDSEVALRLQLFKEVER